jgi:lysophospholipase L1-like esterase
MRADIDSLGKGSRLSTPRKILFAAILYFGFLLVIEAGARLVFFVAEDFNPFYLSFGFVPNIEWHSDEYDGYTKFQPRSTYHQKTHGGIIDMQINSDGFRGARDFVKPKPPGTIRIAAMGASSTFGYYDHDDETYPTLLQGILEKSHPNLRIEVMNLGIPHYRLDNILALARAELAGLEPDFVVLYAGYNNAMIHESPEQGHVVFRFKSWLNFHSVAWRTVKPMVRDAYYNVAQLLNRDIGRLPNLHVPVLLSEKDVTKLRTRVSGDFEAQLREFGKVVTDTGAVLVPVTQTYTLRGLGDGMGLDEKWSTYAEEVSHIEEVLERDGAIPAPQSTLLIHRDFMQAMRDLAHDAELPLVDGIAAVDGRRDEVMASYVHLTGEGNELLAKAISNVLVESGAFPP